MNRVMVIAAHPDDEILGVGGTVKKHVQNEDEVIGLILGEGQTSRYPKRDYAPNQLIEKLHQNTLEAAKVVGYQEIHFSDFPDNRFDSIDLLDIVKTIEYYISKIKPSIIYTHHGGDLNIDHQRTYQAVMTATRPTKNALFDEDVKEIYTFETLSSTEWEFSYQNAFLPNVFIDVTETFDSKLKAMKCYESELCEFPHSRSLKGLEVTAQKWGSVVGKEYVEAFMNIRTVK